MANTRLREDRRVPERADDTTDGLRRLYPEPATDLSIADAYLDDRPPPGDRPWVMVTMVTSVDGTTAVGGRSGPLGNRTDSAVLSATRALADVVLVGAGTVRAERYGPPRTPGQRIGVISGTGDVDTTSPLFTSGAGFLVMPHDAPDAGVPTLRVGHGSIDIAATLGRLHEMVGEVNVVQCEGGPTLNAALADACCIDEVNLTVSPRLAGGDGRRLLHGAVPQAFDLQLVTLLVDGDGYLFSRWQRR